MRFVRGACSWRLFVMLVRGVCPRAVCSWCVVLFVMFARGVCVVLLACLFCLFVPFVGDVVLFVLFVGVVCVVILACSWSLFARGTCLCCL